MLSPALRETAADIYWAEGWLALYRALEANHILSLVGGELPDQWLDAGCGDGRFAKLLNAGAARFGFPTGVDEDHFRLARAARQNVYSRLEKCVLEQLPFSSQSYDVVVCNSVLEHCINTHRILMEFGRVLRPNGRIILTVPTNNFESLLFGFRFFSMLKFQRLAKSYAKKMSRHIRHFNYWEPHAIANELTLAGFLPDPPIMFCSPFVSSIGDCLHMIRIVGIGGSRFSLLTEQELSHRAMLRFLKKWVSAAERRLIEIEEDREHDAKERFGMMVISATKK